MVKIIVVLVAIILQKIFPACETKRMERTTRSKGGMEKRENNEEYYRTGSSKDRSIKVPALWTKLCEQICVMKGMIW